MKKIHAGLTMAAVMVWFLGIASVAMAQHGHDAAAPHQTQAAKSKELKIGKTGEVTLSEQTLIGEMVLEAGRYEVQHRVAGQDHFIHFTKLSKDIPYYRTRGRPVAHPGEMKCELKPLSEKARYSKIVAEPIEGKVLRVTRIEIQGENVAHIFQ